MGRPLLAARFTGLAVAATVASAAGTANAQDVHNRATSAVTTPAGTRVTSTSPGTEMLTPAVQSSVPRPAGAPCGYQQGISQQYNHCGNTTVIITVEHVFGSDDHYCVSPGMNSLNAGGDPFNKLADRVRVLRRRADQLLRRLVAVIADPGPRAITGARPPYNATGIRIQLTVGGATRTASSPSASP